MASLQLQGRDFPFSMGARILKKRLVLHRYLDGDKDGRSAADEIVLRLARKIFVRAVDVPDSTQPDISHYFCFFC